MQKRDEDDEPPTKLTRMVKGVKCRYSFVKTVYSLQELDDFRFENGCKFSNVKHDLYFEKITLKCKMNSQLGKHCHFTLLAWQPSGLVEGDNEKNVQIHMYECGKHNHQLKHRAHVRRSVLQKKSLWSDAVAPVPSFISDGKKWTFLETAEHLHLHHQFDKLKWKYNCIRGRLKEMEKLKEEQQQPKQQICRRVVRCVTQHYSGCSFRLLVQNTDRGRSHLYSSSEHTCQHKERVANVKHISLSLTPEEIEEIDIKKQQKEKEQNGAEEPPPSVLTKVVKTVKFTYNYLKTVHSLKELDSVRVEHQCCYGAVQRRLSNFQNVRLHCQKKYVRTSKCPFGLLACRLTPNSALIHVYADSNQHNHPVKTAEESAMYRMPKKVLLSDGEQPPASFATPNGRQWCLVETAQSAEEVEEWRKKFHCLAPAGRKSLETIERQSRTRMRCTFMMSRRKINCQFQLLIQKTDRGRFRVYRSSTHTCLHADEARVPDKIPLSDENPPSKITTRARQWTFIETVESEVNMAIQLQKWKKKFHCSLNKKSKSCKFALLAHKTDKGRFHLYRPAGIRHMCLHAGKRGEGRLQEMEESEDEEEEDDEEEIDEESYDEESGEEEEMDDEEEGTNDEEDEHVKEIEDEEDSFQDDEEDDDYVEEEKECVEMEGKVDDDDNGQEALSMADSLRSRSQTVPHEINDIQFVDFVDHPKSEGVKMLKLGKSKEEPGANAVMITLEEEEPVFKRKMKMPKLEIVKEEVPEEQAGSSNCGQKGRLPQQAAIGTAAVPMTTINRKSQQQPMMMASRERWWAKEDRVEVAPNNEKRLLRERKSRIDYRE